MILISITEQRTCETNKLNEVYDIGLLDNINTGGCSRMTLSMIIVFCFSAQVLERGYQQPAAVDVSPRAR